MASHYTMEDLEKQLKGTRRKMTNQRRTVLSVFIQHPSEHLSAEEVYNILREQKVDVGMATVYRSLELLAGLGILQRMEFGDGCSRYEIAENDPSTHHHHHLVCLKCGKVSEFPDDMLDELEADVDKRAGFQVINHQVMLLGYCKECR